MTNEEILFLADAMASPPFNSYKGWNFEYEYPGYFVYRHERIPFAIYFTPEYIYLNEIDLEIQDKTGYAVESESLPFFSKSPEDLFAIIRQWLDYVVWNVEVRGQNRESPKDWRPIEKYQWIPRREMPF